MDQNILIILIYMPIVSEKNGMINVTWITKLKQCKN